jgi:ADP-sugar diphosphatase
MQFTYSPSISPDDYSRVEHSPLFTSWIEKVQMGFRVTGVHFESADFVTRKGQRILLFLKLKASATDEKGTRVPGIVVLRGNVVAVLIVLWCESKPYLLLVDQPRFAIGERHSLEIVAGMLDWSADWRKVALEELHEEAGMQVDDSELIELSPSLAVSCGLLDERIHLAAVERTVTPEELAKYDDREQTYLEENEGIRTVVLPYEDAASRFLDAKCLNALYLYERWKRGGYEFRSVK